MASPRQTLTSWEKIYSVLLLPILFLNILHRLTTLTLTTALNWHQTLVLSYLQAEYATFTADQRHVSSRKHLTGQAISSYCSSHNVPHTKITLQPTTTTAKNGVKITIPPAALLILPLRPSGPTLFYSHGGAYTKPLRATAHVPFVLSLAKARAAKQVVFLEYSLAPEYPYPTQLAQLVEAVRHLLDSGLEPGQMVLAGDSAGGHLTPGLLAHVVHPSPYVSPLILEEGNRFRAVVLVSPFVDLDTRRKSFGENEGTDYLDDKAVEKMITLFGPVVGEVWGDICGAEEAKGVWGRVVRDVVGRVMITAGRGEVLLDGIRMFGREIVGAKTVGVGRGDDVGALKGMDLVLLEAVGEAHVQPALDAVLGYGEGNMMRGIVAILKGCLDETRK